MWTAKEALNTFPEKPLEGSQSPIPYFHLLERLKTTRREGWKRHGINGESIADHSYRMALMAMMAPADLDTNKCIQMCLIHDIAESLVGDITPADGIPKEEKERRERSAIDWIADDLLLNVDGGHGEKIRTIWREFEASVAPESRYVQDIDKVELLLQMVEYEKRAERKTDLSEFAYVETKLRSSQAKEWAKEILEERNRFWGEGKPVHDQTGDVKRLQDQYYGV
ncbi:HD domain-containing protein [Ustulina deusta]|nr:HD domain-containing protein [Ustulina deusta]